MAEKKERQHLLVKQVPYTDRYDFSYEPEWFDARSTARAEATKRNMILRRTSEWRWVVRTIKRGAKA